MRETGFIDGGQQAAVIYEYPVSDAEQERPGKATNPFGKDARHRSDLNCYVDAAARGGSVAHFQITESVFNRLLFLKPPCAWAMNNGRINTQALPVGWF